MKVETIIESIEMLKSDYKRRYGVEPNTCTMSEDLFQEMDKHIKRKFNCPNYAAFNKVCGMNILIRHDDYRCVQVGYLDEFICLNEEE